MEAQTIELVAWFVLRAVFAWMFLYPAVGLVRDFGGAVETTALAFPFAPRFFAAGGIAVMVLGGLMILVGFYGAFAGLALVAFNRMWPSGSSGISDRAFDGQVFVVVVITVAAAQVVVGLGILLSMLHNRDSVDVDDVSLLKW